MTVIDKKAVDHLDTLVVGELLPHQTLKIIDDSKKLQQVKGETYAKNAPRYEKKSHTQPIKVPQARESGGRSNREIKGTNKSEMS
mmetsp:Transcript_19800/g.44963  ORF Transcript_19800/g.44963 Transcript_19800/m.44963 type:complete len:85 (+) Transcript_19800:492-746(+)|eukprot:CAMPEP_0113300676 /NCGR_PEP_ID=MMETSP0010_2-20120614/2205_1 /TAXON_ID=216773 ORGANISM="Corethron hystrix, Strain 308" /NCGR_SAMPLE_ID=MMETSP0010_2 /ASSEMBLY_ACC=CAM_ASM_000155 /LENGTH=84 /DNA_ID=CAMNT_0000154137 /DNA_START=110 /DNA_END=364 /DNA_ORIENTATION=+ /assembly_acc=CAM_ASM_000155